MAKLNFRLRPVLIIVVIILVFDIALAQFLKHTADFWAGTYPAMDHRIRSKEYHHTFAPGRQVVERWGRLVYSFATNSLGFKDSTPRAVKAKPNGKRILLLGDSFTEGAGYAFADTFAGQIQRAMEAKNIEILNAGVGSYAPIIYELKTRYLMEKAGLEFDHVVIFLDVSDIFDEARNYQLDSGGALVVLPDNTPKTSRILGHFLRDNSVIGRNFTLIRDQLGGMRKAVKLRLRIARESGVGLFDVSEAAMRISATTEMAASRWTFDDEAWADYGAEGRQKAANRLDKLLAYVEGRGIKMTLVVYPWPDQILFDPDAPRHLGFWRQWAGARGVQFIDLFEVYTGGASVDTLM
ncbi:MAG: hypothetical protein VYE18_04135, partial [Pseudomonadota bacterium]|nr:hypothetical protein [Pseudomonadota bacterium]